MADPRQLIEMALPGDEGILGKDVLVVTVPKITQFRAKRKVSFGVELEKDGRAGDEFRELQFTYGRERNMEIRDGEVRFTFKHEDAQKFAEEGIMGLPLYISNESERLDVELLIVEVGDVDEIEYEYDTVEE